tara:strand:+ start:294 stop:863 length:570 start_codon:yes stop_codon:yes gene_type:complete
MKRQLLLLLGSFILLMPIVFANAMIPLFIIFPMFMVMASVVVLIVETFVLNYFLKRKLQGSIIPKWNELIVFVLLVNLVSTLAGTFLLAVFEFGTQFVVTMLLMKIYNYYVASFILLILMFGLSFGIEYYFVKLIWQKKKLQLKHYVKKEKDLLRIILWMNIWSYVSLGVLIPVWRSSGVIISLVTRWF